MILLDTNILTRITNSADPSYAIVRSAIEELTKRSDRLIIVPQNLYEFWAVATRAPGAPPSGQNGLGMTTQHASQWLEFFQSRFTFLPDRDDLARRWHELVRTHEVRGFRSHDARLVAAMQCYGIARLLTFNAAHFSGYGVEIVTPSHSK